MIRFTATRSGSLLVGRVPRYLRRRLENAHRAYFPLSLIADTDDSTAV